MSDSLNPAAPHHLPAFITAPGETDVLMVVMAVFLILAVLAVGLLFLRLHTLPERMAHKSQKLQFEIVAVLGLLALFTHMHIFWVAGLLLALIDLPDFGTAAPPDGRVAGEDRRHPAGRGRDQGWTRSRRRLRARQRRGCGRNDVPKTIVPAGCQPVQTPAIPGKAELIHA